MPEGVLGSHMYGQLRAARWALRSFSEALLCLVAEAKHSTGLHYLSLVALKCSCVFNMYKKNLSK